MYIKRDVVIEYIIEQYGILEYEIYDLNYYTDPIHYSTINYDIIEYQYKNDNTNLLYVGFIPITEYNFRLRKYKIDKLMMR